MNNLTPIKVELLDWQNAQAQAAVIRRAVFIEEQSVPEELEWDADDTTSLHALAWANGQAIATGRLLPDGHIGRMAVLKPHRGHGVGQAVLLALMHAAHERGLNCLRLHAQIDAVGFYQRQGFEVQGDEYLEAGISHVNMEKKAR